MSLTTPTTSEINVAIISQLESALNQTIPLLPKSFLRVLAKVLAGVFILLYKYAGSIFLNMFVATASAKATVINGRSVTPLNEWGNLIGVGLPGKAVRAELLIDITVEVQTGILPSGTQLINSDNGVTYITIGAVTLDAPIIQATIRAVNDQAGGGGAGVVGNLEPATVVSFANPLANVARDTVVVSQTITGANAESTTAYRQRIIDRFQKRPQGGALADYEEWGEEPTGIINVYPYTSENPGQVDVYVEATVASSGSPDGIPTGAQLQAVLDSINSNNDGRATRRPAGALVNTFAIIRTGFDVEITGLAADNLAQVQTNITTAISNYMLDREPFITGLSILPRQDRITASAIGGIIDDIVTAAGGTFTSFVVEEGAVPFTTRLLLVGEKAKAASVTFI